MKLQKSTIFPPFSPRTYDRASYVHQQYTCHVTTVLNSLSIKRNFVLHAGSYAENFATGQEILWFITMQNVEALGGI